MVTGSIMYRLLVVRELEQTSLLFIGIPAVLASIIVLARPARSTIGMTLKGITICLLMSGILLGEGFICIVMASPLFYGVGFVIAAIADYFMKQRDQSRSVLGLILLLVVPASLEGVSDRLSLNRDESVGAERIVAGSLADVERALATTPSFDRPLPFYLTMGFPRPGQAIGAGLNLGDRRVIQFAGGEGKPGDLVLEVAEHASGLIRFRALSDGSHISHWLDWKEAEVRWSEVAPGQIRIQWTLRFTRRLDPAWYFAPWERYAARLAAGYLIDTVATPRESAK